NQKKIIDENFAYYVLISKQVYIQFQKLATGSTVKNLNIDRIKSVSIPLPPLSEQKQIVSEIEKRFAKADKIENLINKSLKNAEILKQSILKQAFSGNLKVKK
ncbi:MAG: restriction endonuclease subunit S, partial [Campylobacter sp.]|nr:restriction endonuclease subunit S [Campylobacter sp.]